MHEIALSIRALAEFILRSGSIDSRFQGLDRGAEGTRLHRRLQKQAGKGYKAEVPLSLEIEQGAFRYTLSGRADGVIQEEDALTVDEIKTTIEPLEALEEDSHPAHWAQGICYAHILCATRGCAGASVQLRYCHVETLEVRAFTRNYTAEALEDFVRGLLERYERWARLSITLKEKRDASLKQLKFPFDGYRDGQRDLAVACYNTFQHGGRLFCCAPTGIGKTVSTLFPAMKAMGEGLGGPIFYLTAKTTTRRAAEEAVELLRRQGGAALDFRSLSITAKDKICFLEERNCTPAACPWAEGYYDRLNDALYALLQTSQTLDRPAIEAAAREYRLCPYELSLDLSEWCDGIICDYNYLFDPVVHLMRFFEGGGGDYLFLIDEAHNLVDRSREMYSAMLQKGQFWELKKQLPKQYKAMHRALAAVNKAFVELRREMGEERVRSTRELPALLQRPLERVSAAAEDFLKDHRGSEWENEVLQLYFNLLFYQRIAEEYDDTYQTLCYRGGNELTVKLFCMDPSRFLDKSMGQGRAAVLFSATLQPLPYYRETLGGGEGAKLLALGSPFPQEHLGLYLARGVSVKYADRERSLPVVSAMLAQLVQGKTGNYIAFFPSYAYMRQLVEHFSGAYPDITLLVQEAGMDEAARDSFLAAFGANPQQAMLGFCVLGGVFGEGIDLVGDRLTGAAVVGVGLPQLGPELDALRDYYNGLNGWGFEYAYQFPGMNKVLQAAGRVIRTAGDRGVVLLVDDRFATRRYQELFPQHWNHWQRVDAESFRQTLAAFWQEDAPTE